jgi:hypothetical protein
MLAVIPPLVGLVVAYLLRGMGDIAQFAGSAATVLVSGAPLYQRALRSDRKQAIVQVEHPQESATPSLSARPYSPIKAGPLTIALSIILGATAYWLIDFLIAQALYPVLDAFSPEFYYASVDVQQAVNFLAVIPPLSSGVLSYFRVVGAQIARCRPVDTYQGGRPVYATFIGDQRGNSHSVIWRVWG